MDESTILEAAPRYDIAQLETGGRNVRFANGKAQLRRDGRPHYSARAYRTTDPMTIMGKLMDAGFTVCRAQSLFSHTTSDTGGKSPWRFGIEAKYPILYPDRGFLSKEQYGYTDRVRILLAHNGRQALRIAPGALRVACTNQFTSSVISIRHTDPEIDHFNEDPAAVLFGMRDMCGDTVRRVEALRGRRAPSEYWTAIETYPRISRPLYSELEHYPDAHKGPNDVEARFSLWSMVQALTATRSPRAIQGAGILLQHHAREAGGVENFASADFLRLFSKN